MRMIWCWLWVLWLPLAWAEKEITVNFNPPNPVRGEPFHIVFTFETSSGDAPVIDFKPVGFEVKGVRNQGISSRTVYQNGRIQVTRQMSITYEALAPKAGRVQMRDLVVTVDGETHREAVVDLQVLEAPLETQDVFIRAEVPKRTLYVGEGVTVRYHLYIRHSLQAFDIKSYPKLDGFMKRFIQEPDRIERVAVDGEPYRRSGVYTARLYPERAGKLVVDPMEVDATYSADPFGGMFGFGGGRDTRTRRLASPAVELEVRPLPPGKPVGFTGLVGRHSFDLKAERRQLLVNEPLEARLTVGGPGNLESLEAPVLWDDQQLEKFDAKADLALSGPEAGVKTFDYTFLGKRPGAAPARALVFSYFDPDTNRYETIRRQLPEVVVAGNVAVTPAAPVKPIMKEADTAKSVEIPVLSLITGRSWASVLTWVLGLVAALGLLLFYKARAALRRHQRLAPSWDEDYRRLKKHGPDVAVVTRLWQRVATDAARDPDLAYWKDVLSLLEQREFATSRPAGDISPGTRHLKALHRALKKHP